MKRNQWMLMNRVFYTDKNYEAGAKDIAKLRVIIKKIDIKNPQKAFEVYQTVKAGKISFETEIKDQFLTMLEGYIGSKQLNAVRQTQKPKKKKKMSARKFIIACCSFLAVFSIGYYVYYSITLNSSNQALEDMAAKVDSYASSESSTVDYSSKEKLKILSKYQEPYDQNPDLAGWVKIENTPLNYPVMQTKQEEQYYLNRNFEKQEDLNGLPFLNEDCDITLPSTNFIIYGHNMRNGSMFATLMDYKDQSFWQTHRYIQFDTIYEEGMYEIVAVIMTKVAKQGEKTFRYYEFIQSDSEDDFTEFMYNIKKMQLYETGVFAEAGDRLITLSTCEYSTTDGRLAVIAKKVTK